MTDCLLCDRWNKTPFAKRYTTPTTAQDTEAAMVLGFWVAREAGNTAPRLCERHSIFLFRLDSIEATQVASANATVPPTQQQLDFQQRAAEVVSRLTAPLAPPPALPLPDVHERTIPAPPPVPDVPVYSPPQQGQLTPATSAPEGTGGKQTFPCPICQRPAVAGELHRCEG